MSKSLKEQNQLKIWLIISANTLFLLTVSQAGAIQTSGLRTMFRNIGDLLPVGLALIISTIVNGLLSADTKARLVFLRWKFALPGHRAFSQYGKSDPRVDLGELIKKQGVSFPTDPIEQNRLWYRLYKSVENSPAILQVHRDFLLTRDYTGLAVLFILFFGAAGYFTISSLATFGIYFLILLAQYFLVRYSAVHYGIRMVTTVLAQAAADKR